MRFLSFFEGVRIMKALAKIALACLPRNMRSYRGCARGAIGCICLIWHGRLEVYTGSHVGASKKGNKWEKGEVPVGTLDELGKLWRAKLKKAINMFLRERNGRCRSNTEAEKNESEHVRRGKGETNWKKSVGKIKDREQGTRFGLCNLKCINSRGVRRQHYHDSPLSKMVYSRKGPTLSPM